MLELHTGCSKVGLQINFSKTKIMANLVPSECFNDVVDNYTYLGDEIGISKDN